MWSVLKLQMYKLLEIALWDSFQGTLIFSSPSVNPFAFTPARSAQPSLCLSVYRYVFLSLSLFHSLSLSFPCPFSFSSKKGNAKGLNTFQSTDKLKLNVISTLSI